MAKQVFFSFHYQDVIDFRANVVRNHWLTKPDREDAGFFDASIWENAKKTSPLELKRLINGELKNTTVTTVLIGSATYARRWVRYEIIKSMEKGNQILGVHINGIKGKNGKTKRLGPNPFACLGCKYSDDGGKLYIYELKNGKWIQYQDLASYTLKTTASPAKRGKFYKLSSTYRIYNWARNDGYNNFAKWVG
ncbi:MAG: TIR domain-containing protein [Candidatus Poribacteria bacterium]|nr:TIR domain-containing protein [Candidatus Poribacteria bacterium]